MTQINDALAFLLELASAGSTALGVARALAGVANRAVAVWTQSAGGR